MHLLCPLHTCHISPMYLCASTVCPPGACDVRLQKENTWIFSLPRASWEPAADISMFQAGLQGWPKSGPVWTPGQLCISKACLILNLQVTATDTKATQRAGTHTHTHTSWGPVPVGEGQWGILNAESERAARSRERGLRLRCPALDRHTSPTCQP